jgi:hypothetical protein
MALRAHRSEPELKEASEEESTGSQQEAPVRVILWISFSVAMVAALGSIFTSRADLDIWAIAAALGLLLASFYSAPGFRRRRLQIAACLFFLVQPVIVVIQLLRGS